MKLGGSYVLVVGLILGGTLMAASPSSNWEKINDEDGITVYRREVPGSPLLAFKGEGLVDAPLPRVATVILDTQRAMEWVEDLKEAKILRRISKAEFIEYDHIGTPIVMKDREFVSHVKMEVDRSAKKLVFRYQSVDEPTAIKTDYVRGDLMGTTFEVMSRENDAKTYIVGEIHADPKGSVPKWIVNWFQKNWPTKTIKNLRAQVSKPDIQEDTFFKGIFNLK